MAGPGAVIVPGTSRAVEYTGGITWFVVMTCVVAASGGMLFGYDIGVTGGVTSMESFLDFFFPFLNAAQHSASTSPYCHFDSQMLQLFTSSLFLAGMVASFPASQATKRWGRKYSMLISAVLYLVGALLVAIAPHLWVLVVGRIFLGFGVGFANQAVTLYNTEMAPAKWRGAMNLTFQMAITLGILVAQIINLNTEHVSYGWRISVGIAGVPAVVLLLGGIFLPETPNSLVEMGRPEEGLAVLRKIRGVEDVSVEFEDIKFAVEVVNEKEKSWTAIFVLREYRPQLVSCIAIPICQQLTGINSIMFYAPQLFSSFGSGVGNPLVSTIIIGAVNVVATLVALFTVDRFGRRPLLLEAGFQMAAAEIAIGVILALGFQGGNLSPTLATAVIVLICTFISAFAWSWGPLGWLIPAEICPIEIRSTGQAINVATNFLFTFIIGQVFLTMLCTFKYAIFFFFAACVLLMTLFAYFFIPETRNVPVENIMSIYSVHWWWSRFTTVRVAPSVAMEAPPSVA